MEDYERSGRPKEATTDENVELVYSLIMCDRRRSLRDIARKNRHKFLGRNQSILTNVLELSNVSAIWISRMLTKDQKIYEDNPEKCMRRGEPR